MNKMIWTKVTTAIVVVLWGVIYILPNFVDVSKIPYFPGKKVNYGLDIQGGLHLVLGVDIAGVTSESTKRLITTVEEDFKTNKKIVLKNSDVKPLPNNQDIKLEFETADQAAQAKAIFEKDYAGQLIVTSAEGNFVELRYNDVYLNDFKKRTLEQAIETIRNRIDEFGVAEPSITAQGTDRILVQLPGIEDSTKAKELINKTARLEFLTVETKDQAEVDQWVKDAETKGNYSVSTLKYSEYVKKVNEDLAGKLPKDTKILFGKADNADNMAAGKVIHLVGAIAPVTGDDLKSAQISFSERNTPEVSMNFNAVGATKFANLTEKYVNRQIAIVLDDVVYSAPNVTERIGGGNARITLNNRNYDASMAEAKMISMALRAGALPAKLEQLEERTVGPSLGKDSIDKAQTAMMIGCGLLLLFMLVWYKGFGVIADVALILNGVFILAILSSLDATLTLPGVAGIALTIGMAVDANIIIYERIKEELKKGLALDQAIKQGYDKAFSAILDSNLTTICVSTILMYYGTGPVRGFAVTLIVGIITTMFTAVFLTRTIAEFLVYKLKVKKIAI
ncbi:MAG: protein translocase subunit SecD [Bdellovibrionota bacterium]